MASDKKTMLYDLHASLNAKMVSFAGYLMPIQYPMGILKEAKHCRQKAGLFDISHMGQIEISLDAVNELEHLCPSSLSQLDVGKQLYTVLTNEEGGIIDDIIIARLTSRFVIIVNAACKTKDWTHLTHHLGHDHSLKQLNQQALLALQGPLAKEIMEQLCPQASTMNFMSIIETEINTVPCVISRSGYTGEDGFEISVANDNVCAMAKQLLSFDSAEAIGLGARDILRVEAGLSLYGQELSERISPVEAGLNWVIKRNNGYLGANHIKQQLADGCKQVKSAWLIDGKIPVRATTPLVDELGQDIGYVTSACVSPTLKHSLAIAMTNSDYQGHTAYTQVRNHKIRLHKTGLPFVPHRYHRSE